MTKVEHLQYKQGIDASNLGLANVYSDLQQKQHDLIDQMMTQSQEDYKEFLQDSAGATLKASGRLGRSSERIAALELGEYLKKGSDKALQLTKSARVLNRAGAVAAGKAKAEQMQMFTNVAFVKNPDMVPPKPVMQNVGAAMFMDALSIGSSLAGIYMPFKQ